MKIQNNIVIQDSKMKCAGFTIEIIRMTKFWLGCMSVVSVQYAGRQARGTYRGKHWMNS